MPTTYGPIVLPPMSAEEEAMAMLRLWIAGRVSEEEARAAFARADAIAP